MSGPIILASGSASRRALLEGAGVHAENIKPYLDEEPLRESMRADGVSIRDQAMRLAELKALKISDRHAGLVIGGDQMLALAERVFDKPVGMEGARAHLEALSGQTHTLETAIAIAENGQIVWKYLARPKLTMRPLSQEFITQYLDACGERVLSSVGAYQLEALGSQLFTQIKGDYFSILGLPLLPLLDYLRIRGVVAS